MAHVDRLDTRGPVWYCRDAVSGNACRLV